MKRATAAHEATVIALTSYILQIFLSEYSDEIDDELILIFDIVKGAAQSIHSSNNQEFRNIWIDFLLVTRNGKLEKKLDEFFERRENKKLLQVYVMYINMVERLFTFIEASRNRNWMLHLSASNTHREQPDKALSFFLQYYSRSQTRC